jgi:hypothetical protein
MRSENATLVAENQVLQQRLQQAREENRQLRSRLGATEIMPVLPTVPQTLPLPQLTAIQNENLQLHGLLTTAMLQAAPPVPPRTLDQLTAVQRYMGIGFSSSSNDDSPMINNPRSAMLQLEDMRRQQLGMVFSSRNSNNNDSPLNNPRSSMLQLEYMRRQQLLAHLSLLQPPHPENPIPPLLGGGGGDIPLGGTHSDSAIFLQGGAASLSGVGDRLSFFANNLLSSTHRPRDSFGFVRPPSLNNNLAEYPAANLLNLQMAGLQSPIQDRNERKASDSSPRTAADDFREESKDSVGSSGGKKGKAQKRTKGKGTK